MSMSKGHWDSQEIREEHISEHSIEKIIKLIIVFVSTLCHIFLHLELNSHSSTQYTNYLIECVMAIN